MNELQLAVKHLKKRIRKLDYCLLAYGCFAIGVMGTLQVLALHPELISLGFIPSFIFALGMTGLMALIIVVLLIFDCFYWAYVPKVSRGILNYRNWCSSTIQFFKNIRTFTAEYVNRKEYNQMIFEEMLKGEKTSVWKWFAQIFMYTLTKFKTNDTEFTDIKNRLVKLEESEKEMVMLREALNKKDEMIDSKNKIILRLRKKLEKYQKKYSIDNNLESDLTGD